MSQENQRAQLTAAPAAARSAPARAPAALRISSRLKRERGVALLIVIISITLLALMASEFAYNSRVDLQLATNQRDEIRAYYLARSGIGMARLLLRFQKQVDNIKLPPGLSALLGGGGLSSLLGGAPGAAAAGAAAAQPPSLNIQLWRMAKIDCHMLQGLVSSDPGKIGEKGPLQPQKTRKKVAIDDDAPEIASAQQARNFGGFEGCFQATIGNEEEKINVGKLDAIGTDASATLFQLMQILQDKRFEFLWEHEDANKVKVNPTDVIVAMKDWVDQDEVQAALNNSGVIMQFARGGSDENYNYDRFTPRYRSKNARFDSVDELFMVHGVNDQFMAAFRDRLTVYPDINAKLNVNSDDKLLLFAAILAVADPNRPDGRLKDPLFVDAIIKRIQSAKMFALFGLSTQDFVGIVESQGVAVNASIKNNAAIQSPVGDKSNTYSIKSVGQAGQVEKTVTAVISLDDALGKLVYWREE